MKTILITGADGFIGSHLCSLLSKEYKIIALIRYNAFNNNGMLKFIKKNHNIKFVTGDITDYAFINRLIKKVDAIFHLAAFIGVPYSFVSVYSYIQNNINGTYNILESAKENNIKHTIIISSSEVYGNPAYIPIDENCPLNPQSPYAATKVSCEALANSYIHSFSMPITILRPFNTYGPHQSLRAVIPTIINQAIKNKTIKLGNTNVKRDFTYIKDMISIFKYIVFNKTTFSLTINIGTGKMYSINEILDIVQSIKGKKLKIIKDNNRIRPKKAEIMQLLANRNLLDSIIEYKNKYSIERGLTQTYKWCEKHIKYFDNNHYVI